MTNLPRPRGAFALLSLGVLLFAGAASADGMGFFGVPSADETVQVRARPAHASHQRKAAPQRATARREEPKPVAIARQAPKPAARQASRSSAVFNPPEAVRPVTLAAAPAPKPVKPAVQRSADDEGLVDLVEAPHHSRTAR